MTIIPPVTSSAEVTGKSNLGEEGCFICLILVAMGCKLVFPPDGELSRDADRRPLDGTELPTE